MARPTHCTTTLPSARPVSTIPLLSPPTSPSRPWGWKASCSRSKASPSSTDRRFFMHRTMRTLLLFVAFVFALGAHAQQYPNHPIKLIVTWPPGGAVDIIGRLVADSITGPLGQPVVVDNRGGAAGAIGSDIAAKSPPDGYTLLMGSTTVISINPALQKLPYAPTDFAPITMVAFVPHILVIPAEVPANNLKEFVAWVKANPGKVSYASAGPGTPHHIAGEMFKSLAGVEMLQVPYKGTGPALIDLMANRVQFMSVEA